MFKKMINKIVEIRYKKLIENTKENIKNEKSLRRRRKIYKEFIKTVNNKTDVAKEILKLV